MIIRSTPRAFVALAVPALLLAGCGLEGRASVAPSASPDDSATVDGGVDGDSLGMCAPGVTDCVDVVIDPHGDVGGDAIVAEDIALSDALPPATRFVEMASDPAAETWPVFLQQAVVRDDQIDVVFSGGEAPCFVVDHVEAEESEAVVIVSVLVRSAASDQVECAGQEISTQALTVPLTASLGDRSLLDGSRTVRPN